MSLTSFYDNLYPIFGEHLTEARHGNNNLRHAP
jgi:hypothetical protein